MIKGHLKGQGHNVPRNRIEASFAAFQVLLLPLVSGEGSSGVYIQFLVLYLWFIMTDSMVSYTQTCSHQILPAHDMS